MLCRHIDPRFKLAKSLQNLATQKHTGMNAFIGRRPFPRRAVPVSISRDTFMGWTIPAGATNVQPQPKRARTSGSDELSLEARGGILERVRFPFLTPVRFFPVGGSDLAYRMEDDRGYRPQAHQPGFGWWER